MENNNRLKLLIPAIVAVVSAFLASAFLLTALSSEFTPSLGYFTNGSVFAPSAYCVLLLGPVIGVLLWVFFRQRYPEGEFKRGYIHSFASAFSGFLILAAVGFDIYEKTFTLMASYNILVYFAAAFGVLAAASLLFSVLGSRENNTAAWLLAFFPPLYFASRVLILYFDKTVAINCPLKVISQFAFIALMLLFTAELGITLGKKKVFPRYLFAAAVSVVLTGAVAISSLVYNITIPGVFTISLADSCMLTALFLLSVVKLFGAAEITLNKK